MNPLPRVIMRGLLSLPLEQITFSSRHDLQGSVSPVLTLHVLSDRVDES